MARATQVPSTSSELPLPKAWSSSIRLALLHVVSLGRTAITHTRGWATYSARREARLRARLDETEAKLAQLETELALKDRRMLRLPSKNRPHYPSEDRLETLLLRAVPRVPCHLYGMREVYSRQ